MESSKPFYDLCINERCCSNLTQFLDKCVEFDYKTIAINQVIDSVSIESKKKKKGDLKGTDIVPEPITINNEKKNVQILNRLTVVFTERNFIHKILQSGRLKKFHIFAVIPKNAEMLQFSCESLETDIISFDPTDGKLPRLHRKLYNKAVERGIHFELMYFPAIVDQSSRKVIINRAHVYHQLGKSKNIIITSGCNNVLTLRGPYDVINLALIFGLSEEQSKYAITSACAKVISRAIGRRTGTSVVIVDKTKENTELKLTNEEEMEIANDEPMQKKIKVNQTDVIVIDN